MPWSPNLRRRHLVRKRLDCDKFREPKHITIPSRMIRDCRMNILTIYQLPALKRHHISSTKRTVKMSFEPKHAVQLDAPKSDPISTEYLSKCDGMTDIGDQPHRFTGDRTPTDICGCLGTNEDYPTYVAIKVCFRRRRGWLKDNFAHGIAAQGTVFDVSGNKSYGPEGSYKVFAGKDASRALAQSSLKAEGMRAIPLIYSPRPTYAARGL